MTKSGAAAVPRTRGVPTELGRRPIAGARPPPWVPGKCRVLSGVTHVQAVVPFLPAHLPRKYVPPSAPRKSGYPLQPFRRSVATDLPLGHACPGWC